MLHVIILNTNNLDTNTSSISLRLIIFKQIYLIDRWNPNRYYHYRSVDLGWQWSTLHFLGLEHLHYHYWLGLVIWNCILYELLVLRINGPGELGSLLGRVIPKTFEMVLDTSLLNTQRYKVCVKDKVEQSRERSSALPYTSV